ncbi:MAG: hypothetical protein ACNA7W_05220 [Pseudomonadales bacterium]
MKIAHRLRLSLWLCLGLLASGCVQRQGPDAGDRPLEETRQLPVTVEGETELRTARLFESPQNYAIYVLPQIVMTPEEPYRDQAFARVDGEFFMRIERLPEQADTADLRANAVMTLAHIGKVHALQHEQIFDPQFRDAEFFLHASNPQVSVIIFVTEIDGSRFRLTMHIPNREAAEGIVPSFWAMLRSIRSLGPLPEEDGEVS